jgi:serine/threonine protein kinase
VENARGSFAAMAACAHCGAPFTPVVSGQTLCDRCQGLMHPEPASPLQQAEIAGYLLLHELGAGRFSHSWLGEDAQGQAVVLKLLRRYAPDPNAVQRFLAEAQRLAGAPELDHPNLARPITAGVHLVSAFFLVYQTGGEQTLADELRSRGRVLPARALELCAQLCEGLAAAHALGVFHLDLKPANVGLTKAADGSEQAVALDLVTAHLLAKAGIHEPGPLPLSSAAYLSPEQAAGKRADARSDLYSVGVLLFQLVSGRLPLMGATADELLEAHRDQPALRLRDVGRRMHDDLEALLACLLAKDPADRFGSAGEAAAMMRAIIPIADTAPMEDDSPGFDDPVPVVEAPRPEPEVAHTPPQMLPPAFDPALVRAMMGEVTAPPEERPPGIPKWAAFVPPRWWPLAAGVGAVAVITVVTLPLARRHGPSKPAVMKAQAGAPSIAQASAKASPGAAAPAGVVKSVVSAAVAEAMQREPARDPARMGDHTAPESPAPQRKTAPPSRWSKQFATAQKALWTGKPASAESVLRKLLRKHLSRPDHARAAKMMGDAEAKKGNKAAAAGWYKKALRLSDDPDDRAHVEKLLR